MPTIRECEATIRQRIRDLDWEIAHLRSEQRGLEAALGIVRGESALARPVSMVEESPRSASGDGGKRR